MDTTFFYQWPLLNMTSISFLYIFLPLSLAAYYLLPHKLRPAALLAISGIYLVLAQPWSLPPIAASVVIDFVIIRLMARSDSNEARRRGLMNLSLCKNILIIILTGVLFEAGRTPLFLGAVVCSLSSLDAVVSFYRREQEYENNPVFFALHCIFFPKLYAGPLSPYRDFSMQLSQIHFNTRSLAAGLGQLAQGGLKIVLFGSQFIALRQRLIDTTAAAPSLLSLWGGAMLFAFALYYMLSGFSDMAQGIGALYGVFLPHNFYYPYQSRSINDFFERFNITAISLLRRNVYYPLRGGEKSNPAPAADLLYLVLCGMLAGIWFGLRINYLLWGAFLMAFIAVERHIYPWLLRHLPTLFCRIGTFLIVLLSFSLMSAATPAEGFGTIASMLGLGGLPLYDDGTLYIFSTNSPTLLVGLFFCTNFFSIILLWLRKNLPLLADILMGAFNILFLAILTAILL